jgi:hypothetical protein
LAACAFFAASDLRSELLDGALKAAPGPAVAARSATIVKAIRRM